MLDVLLVRIQPTDRRLEGLKYFPDNNEPLSFEMPVFNGNPLQFQAGRKYYEGSESLIEKVKATNTDLGVDYGGHAVAIDKYPLTRFKEGASLTAEYSGMSHYDFEADFENSGCDCLVLSVPGLQPIPISKLRFSCDGVGADGFYPDAIVFRKEAVLSVTLPFGEIKGIALKHCGESALNPTGGGLCYTMSFEKVSLPAVVLQKLLDTKPQADVLSDTPVVI